MCLCFPILLTLIIFIVLKLLIHRLFQGHNFSAHFIVYQITQANLPYFIINFFGKTRVFLSYLQLLLFLLIIFWVICYLHLFSLISLPSLRLLVLHHISLITKLRNLLWSFWYRSLTILLYLWDLYFYLLNLILMIPNFEPILMNLSPIS